MLIPKKKSQNKISKKTSRLKNERGMAILEIIPIITIIVLLLNFSIGFFGAIHTGILQSIAARNYAFETFSNRANLVYFKNSGSSGDRLTYEKVGMRVHGTVSEKSTDAARWVASSRLIDFMSFNPRAAEVLGNSSAVHDDARNLSGSRNETVSVNPIWIKTTYGICLNSTCSGT